MDIQYKELLQHILDSNDLSDHREDRTGTGTYSVFGYQMRFDLNEGFPAQTTKKLAWRAVVAELIWFLEGGWNERRLAELTYGKLREELEGKKTIWTANYDAFASKKQNNREYGSLGPIYGVQWRSFNSNDCIDQISNILYQLKETPNSRRIILNAWDASDIDKMALPPCHVMSQFYVKDGKLSCHMYQRSADVFLGLPFNIASYALLTHILANEVGLDVGELIISLGDAHIYCNHIDQVREVLQREPYSSPTLHIDKGFELNRVLDNKTSLHEVDNFTLLYYNHHNEIKADMAV